MTVSMLAALILSQALTAEQALATHRRELAPATETCAPLEEGDDAIVVCANRRENSRYRAPRFAVRGRVARPPGELQVADLRTEAGSCGVVGQAGGCGGGLDIIAIGLFAVKVAAQALSPTDPIAPPVPVLVTD